MANLSDFQFQICQINSVVGDIATNEKLITEQIKRAEAEGNVDILIFPELCLSGYFPRDLLYYDSFIDEIHSAMKRIASSVRSTIAIIGSPWYDEDKGVLRNAAVILEGGTIDTVVFKTLLPDYDVFDESRYFLSDAPRVIEIKGIKVGLQICEDLWDHLWMHNYNVTEEQFKMGAELFINISASPYTLSKPLNRLRIVQDKIKNYHKPFIYVNLVGGQDELVFDGRSFACSSSGELVFIAKKYAQDVRSLSGLQLSGEFDTITEEKYVSDDLAEIRLAIVLNLQDYLRKSKLSNKLLVSISGGIDSALTTVLATEAVGPENMMVVYLPTRFSSNASRKACLLLAKSLEIPMIELDIEEIRNLFDNKLRDLDLVDDLWSIADENIQARIRSTIMMYLSNKTGRLLISTGNKSEISVGYCTLYGDTAGGKNLIGDLYKHQVYALAHHINQNHPIIPESIIERPPTAELKEDQLDSDSLPPYDILDAILVRMIDGHKSTSQIVAEGYQKETVEAVSKLVIRSEFKRDQIVQTVKVSDIAFGFGWKMPISNRFYP